MTYASRGRGNDLSVVEMHHHHSGRAPHIIVYAGEGLDTFATGMFLNTR